MSGIIDKRIKDTLGVIKYARYFESEDLGVFVITLFHLQGAFYLLFIGLSISSLQFLLELYAGRFL
jgi:hypothetical protein